jgi:hypothetical protein
MSKQANGPGHNPLDGQAMGTTIKSCFVGAVSSFTAAVVKSALIAWLDRAHHSDSMPFFLPRAAIYNETELL